MFELFDHQLLGFILHKGCHLYKAKARCTLYGLVRDLNPGPLAPKARIIPLDQRASANLATTTKSHKVLWLSRTRHV